ncbi:MAG: sigma-70 family RNA polymerase sigma factor [Runella slithyformis]|nr:MAG: sigma-70 family RNA polymerase sigma factor [Runella slithyformis]
MEYNEIVEKNLNHLKAIASKFIWRFELNNQIEASDLVNDAYLHFFYKNDFNSEDHLIGSFLKYVKLCCMTERRKLRKRVQFGENMACTYMLTFEKVTEKIICDEFLISKIEEEQNQKHKQLLYLLGAGHSYDYIADNLCISRKNIRFHQFEAKRKLIKRMEMAGVNVTNNTNTRATINLALKTQDALLYDDFPFSTCNYEDLVRFVLGKSERGLSRHEIVCIIAKNRNMSFANCRNPFKVAIDKLIKKREVIYSFQLYYLTK